MPEGLPAAEDSDPLVPRAASAAHTITRPPAGVSPWGQRLPTLALGGAIAALLLLLALWLSGWHLGLFPDMSNQPTLIITSPGPYTIGSSITLRGAHFAPNSLVALLRDGQPATDAQGMRQSLETDPHGAFTFTLPITPDWQPGEHLISAEDTTSQQRASISIEIASAGS